MTPRRIVEAISRVEVRRQAKETPQKPVAFDYARPATVAQALGMLAGNAGARVLAGGQTLGPMLNLRLAQPALLVDITRIPELAAASEDGDSVAIGATVTHAAIEDGRIPLIPPTAFSRASPAASPIARCARAAPSAAAWPMPTPPRTGSPASPRSGPQVVVTGADGSRRGAARRVRARRDGTLGRESTMNLDSLLAALHLLGLALGPAAVWARARALRGTLDRAGLARVFLADTAWGIAAGIWLSTGLVRLLGPFAKGTGYYLANHLFWTKMALFLAIFALEIAPMVALIQWRAAYRRGEEVDTRHAARFARTSDVQLFLLLAILLAATAMARGLGAMSSRLSH